MVVSVATVAASRVATTAKWLIRGFWAIADQGLFALSNFALNVLLARWLPQEEYGAFAVAFSVFLLLGAFHTAVLTEPMLVFGASKYAAQFRQYLGVLLYGHAGLASGVSLLLAFAALACWWFGDGAVAQALGGLAFAAPFILLMWLVRRAFYVQSRLHWAAIGSTLYLLVMVAGAYVLYRRQWLAPFSAFGVMGIAGLLGGLGLTVILQPQWRSVDSDLTIATVFADHWEYGSWNVLATAVYWASGQILVVLVPIVLGLHAAAILAAVFNLFRPLNPLLQSISAMMLPIASRQMRQAVQGNFVNTEMWRFFYLCTGGVLFYGLVATVFSEQILHSLYGSQYGGQGRLIFLLTLVYVASAVVQGCTVIIKAAGDTKKVVAVWALSALFTGVFSLPALFSCGLEGGVIIFAASYTIAAVISWKQASTLTTRQGSSMLPG
jgi:O-antigen/teichoic acid export membrane protein